MSESSHGADTGPRHRDVEVLVAVLTALFAVIVIIGSLNVGIGWAPDGPRAGFFPFYIGALILGASVVNIGYAIVEVPRQKLFADWHQLGRVVSVVVPTAVYVALINWIGIYVSSALLIGFFMKWLGKYRWTITLPLAIGVPILLFIVFERWFLVPLPKGPVEEWLGY
jgi:putative tricarboxylic transport membrane protein